MLASTQTVIDRPPGEWPSFGTLACLAAPDGRLQSPSRLVFVEDFRPAIQRDLADDLGHGLEILKRIQRQRPVTRSHESCWSTTVLRRAGTTAADAGRVCLSHFRLLAILDANLVAPRNVQVVLVDEPGNLSELQRRKGHVRRGRRQFRRAVTGGAKAELVEVDAFRTHRGLEHAVQLAQGTGRGHQLAPSHHRADAKQPHLDLHNRVCVRRGRRKVLCRQRLLRPARHPDRLLPHLPLVLSTPQILMLSYEAANVVVLIRRSFDTDQ